MGFAELLDKGKNFGAGAAPEIPDPPKKRGPKPKPKPVPIELSPQEKARIKLDREVRKKEKKQLVDAIFDENGDNPDQLIDIIKPFLYEVDEEEMPRTKTTATKPTARTRSSLEGIKHTMEDLLSINELGKILKNLREKKNDDEENGDGGMDLGALLPLLMGNNNGNGGGLNLDSILPLLLAGGNKKSNSNLPLVMMMMNTMMNKNSNSDTDPKLIREMYKEIKKAMSPQQSGIDPNMILLLKAINQPQQQPQPNRDIEKLLVKFEQIQQQNQQNQLQQMLANQDNKYERLIDTVLSVIQSDPKQEIVSTFGLLKEIQGDSRSKSKDEMEYELKKQELNMSNQLRRDAIEREERKLEREEQKSERFLENIQGIASTLLGGKGIPDLVGNLAGKKVNQSMNNQITKSMGDDLGDFDLEDLEDL